MYTYKNGLGRHLHTFCFDVDVARRLSQEAVLLSLLLSSMMLLWHDEDARPALSFERIVAIPHHLPSNPATD
jgi:hypothetical protein